MHPSSREFHSIVQADPTLGGPDGGSTRRHHQPLIFSLSDVDNLLRDHT